MQVFYYDAESRQCLGSFGPGAILPAKALPTSVAPVDGRQLWMGSTWAWPIDVIRAEVLGAITRRYQAALASGLSYGGKVLQIREQDQLNLAAMGNEARWAKANANAAAWPSDFAWRMADDTFLILPDPEAMIALAETAKNEIQRLQLVKWMHVDAVRGLRASAAIADYDFETGWRGA